MNRRLFVELSCSLLGCLFGLKHKESPGIHHEISNIRCPLFAVPAGVKEWHRWSCTLKALNVKDLSPGCKWKTRCNEDGTLFYDVYGPSFPVDWDKCVCSVEPMKLLQDEMANNLSREEVGELMADYRGKLRRHLTLIGLDAKGF